MTAPLPTITEPRAGCRPTRAMVLAAGLGTRMRPITNVLPKPLVRVGDRALLDRALDALAAVGVEDVVVNVFHLGEVIARHVAERSRPRVLLSREAERLETGGGVRRALPLLGETPFFVVNGDVLWTDGREASLSMLAEAWDDRWMDALLLLQPTATALGYEGLGDFLIEPDGRLRRRPERDVAPFLFAGLQILHPRLFEGSPEGLFSLNVLYDRALAKGRLFGVRHEGGWCHVGTPADIPIAEHFLKNA